MFCFVTFKLKDFYINNLKILMSKNRTDFIRDTNLKGLSYIFCLLYLMYLKKDLVIAITK